MISQTKRFPARVKNKLTRMKMEFFGEKSNPNAKASPNAPFTYTRPPYFWAEENSKIKFDVYDLRKFKDRHKGERCFIVGNGPSLNKMDLSKLKNEVSFGVNGIFYMTETNGFRPTYYVVEDSHVIKDNLEKINAYEVEHKFFPSVYRDLVPADKKTSFFRMNIGYYLKSSPNYGLPRFSTDISERIYCGQSVTYMNLQLAYYMGFEKVYLIGCDFHYVIPKSAIVEGMDILSTEDDPNHFHPEYFGKGKKWHTPQLDRVYKNYQNAGMVFHWSGRQVLNATPGSKLDVFEMVDFDSLF